MKEKLKQKLEQWLQTYGTTTDLSEMYLSKQDAKLYKKGDLTRHSPSGNESDHYHYVADALTDRVYLLRVNNLGMRIIKLQSKL